MMHAQRSQRSEHDRENAIVAQALHQQHSPQADDESSIVDTVAQALHDGLQWLVNYDEKVRYRIYAPRHDFNDDESSWSTYTGIARE